MGARARTELPEMDNQPEKHGSKALAIDFINDHSRLLARVLALIFIMCSKAADLS